MHELSIVSGMLQQLEKLREEQHWKHILKVEVVVGLLSGIESHSLRSCFELLTQEWEVPPQLHIRVQPLEFHCHSCHKISHLIQMDLKCEACGKSEGHIQGEQHMHFTEIEGEPW